MRGRGCPGQTEVGECPEDPQGDASQLHLLVPCESTPVSSGPRRSAIGPTRTRHEPISPTYFVLIIACYTALKRLDLQRQASEEGGAGFPVPLLLRAFPVSAYYIKPYLTSIRREAVEPAHPPGDLHVVLAAAAAGTAREMRRIPRFRRRALVEPGP